MLKLITKAQAAWATRDRGATAVEYGLMIALIAAVILVIVASLGGGVKATFQKVCTSITGAACAS